MSDFNKAREQLANERTFLAWLRTAIGVIIFGFAVARFGLAVQQLAVAEGTQARTTGVSVLLGNVAILFGIGMILVSLIKYRSRVVEIDQGQFSTAKGLVAVIAVVSAIFAAALIAYLLFMEHSLNIGVRQRNSKPAALCFHAASQPAAVFVPDRDLAESANRHGGES